MKEPEMAWVTAYVCQDKECINAMGKHPVFGTVACGRGIPLGTRIAISGIGTFTCEDRYAKWLDEKRDLQTVDLFSGFGPEAERAAKVFGKQLLEIKIL